MGDGAKTEMDGVYKAVLLAPYVGDARTKLEKLDSRRVASKSMFRYEDSILKLCLTKEMSERDIPSLMIDESYER